MTPRTERPNWFATRARAAKADALFSEILRLGREIKAGPDRLQPYVTKWGRAEWAKLAVSIGKRPPSDATVTAVLAQLARAALVERLARAS